MAKILGFNDFFSLSECRDLLFHVQEHRFTLRQIEKALEELNLKFLGFEMPNQAIMKAFKKDYPGTQDATSLSLWGAFELENPDAYPRHVSVLV